MSSAAAPEPRPSRGSQGPWPSARTVRVVAAFVVLYALAVWLGRLSRLPGTSLALVWPAAAVGFVWMLWAAHRGRRVLAAHALLLAVLAGVVNGATGAPLLVAVTLGAANALQGLVETAVLLRWRADAWRLRRSSDVFVLVTASALGALAGAAVGPAVLIADGQDPAALVLAWTLRNTANTFVFSCVVLRLAGGAQTGHHARGGWAELGAAGLVLVAVYSVVFGATAGLQLSFVVLPLSMWIALRFCTNIASGHVLVSALFVVALTMVGRGPFAEADPATRVLLAQSFVAVLGIVTLVLALHRDERQSLIADLRAAHQRAADQAEALATASRHKTAFLSTMSHEIRTPLNGVLGFTALLADDPRSRSAPEWARAADASGRTLLALVNDVLDMAKIEAGALEVDRADLDLVEVAQQAVLPSRRAASDKEVDLHLLVEDGLVRRRLGDPLRLQQVLTNLVANAVKFTDTGSVTVRLQGGPHDEVHLTVVDTGPGMTEREVERVFAPFEQAAVDTARRFGGTGLGLSITRSLVEAMAGRIDVTSEPGHGTAIGVVVPLPCAAPGVRAEPLRAAEARPVPRERRLRVLVAEDNEVNQLVARATLEAHDLVVDVVGDGEAALAAVTSTSYDAVFMDQHMPRLDGLAATRRLRELGHADLPVVAMTAAAFDDDRRACLAAGMTHFLPKPWSAEQLEDVLRLLHDRVAVG